MLVFLMFFSLLGISAIQDVKVVEAANITDEGTNDVAMNAIIKNVVDQGTNLGDGAFIKRWEQFSWSMDNSVPDDWKWDGTKANVNADATNTVETNPRVIPDFNQAVIKVYSPHQLYYLFQVSFLLNGKTISIESDLDFSGYEYAWMNAPELENLTIVGNGHTLYNIGGGKSFIKSVTNVKMSDVVFDSAKLVTNSEDLLGIVGLFKANANKNEFNRIRIQNSLFFSSKDKNFEAYLGPLGESKGLVADHIATVNNVMYATKAHIGGLIALSDNTEITNSYSVDSIVVARGNHSGGFSSCSNGGIVAENCFTNNEVYGNEETGVFIGAVMENYGSTLVSSFTNCYTSGSIEGTTGLGGFIGVVDPMASAQQSVDFKVSFDRCYSTSIVGMQSGGKNLGGFIGYIKNPLKTPVTLKDCFAAGEVGSIDTDLTSTTKTVGGFIGKYSLQTSTTNPGVVFENSYYDKQTTAMRELESGQTRDRVNSVDGIGLSGLKGVLTSDSNKFGSGLASQPHAVGTAGFDQTYGFNGFNGDTPATGVIVTNPNWVYDGGNTNSSLHNCMYPQLSVFFNSTDAFVRAYSYASVATVHEAVWDESAYGEVLPNETYDTVRDLTMRFTMTSYIDNAKDVNASLVWTKENTPSSIYPGNKKQVINYFQKTLSSKYNRNYWTSDKFAPGIEWMKINVELDDTKNNKKVVGSRRLRIIPTANLTPGSDQIDLLTGGYYDHAKDMYMAYSTAQK